MKRWLQVAAVLLCAVTSTASLAQAYPSRAIRVIVPYPAGGLIDIATRALTERLAPGLGQSILVENRPGGHSVLAHEAVLASAPDGYTWLAAPPAFATNVSLMQLRFDPLRDFLPVARFALSADYFFLPATLPVANLQEYVNLVKSQPGKHNHGIPGIGGAAHIAFEQFKRAAGIDLTGIPYQGAVPIIADLINVQLTSAFIPGIVGVPQAKAGKIRAVAVNSPRRQSLLPEVPTFAELGMPSVQATLWVGIAMPGKTPREIQRRVAAEIERAVNAPDFAARLAGLGAEPAYLGPEAFEAFIRQEIETSGKVVRDAGIKIQ
jgi:tripartite-type tricarboxylate transporter receptor subunit TctC